MPTFQLSTHEPPSVELTRKLLAYLTSGELDPGQKLPGERALSESLGVGRALLRGSMKSLTLLGVLEQRQGDGTYLAATQSSLLPKVIEWGLLLGRPDLEELVEARCYVEVIVAELAAQRADADSTVRLRGLYEEMVQAGDDVERFVDADVRFHLELAQASGNSVLGGVIGNIRSLVRVWTTRVITAAQETESSLAMHLPVVEAIEARNPERARDAMQALVDRGFRRLNKTLENERLDLSSTKAAQEARA